jgi:predicted ATPase
MITRMKVQNFKSLRDFELELGPINVLVGPNLAGKSNVIDVFKFLFDLLHPSGGQEGLWFALNNRGGLDLAWKGSSTSFVSISIEGDRVGERDTHWIYELGIFFPPNGSTEIQREALRLRRGAEERELIGERSGARWLKNYDGKEIAQFPGGYRSVLQGRVANWDGDFLAALIESWTFHQFIPALMKQPNKTGTGRALDKTGSNLSAWLMWKQTHDPDQFARIAQAARDLLPGLRSLLTTPTEQGTVYISAQESGLISPVNVWQMSDGEVALLALLSLIYSPPEWAGSLYCIEEPENHLYPKLLSAVVRLLRQVREEVVQAREEAMGRARAAIFSPPSAVIQARQETMHGLGSGATLSQLVITTHSPQLVDLFSLDEVIWLEKKEGATAAVRPRDKKHLRELVRDKELGLADVVYSGILSEPE